MDEKHLRKKMHEKRITMYFLQFFLFATLMLSITSDYNPLENILS